MEDTEIQMEPLKIQRLRETVINRIAAGSVIQRPLSVVKVLLENSLDASASYVHVLIKGGGFKLIQVSDDGHGIRFEDLPILCKRHTTSISAFDDLQRIKCMGFCHRGEALASMTYVGHVTVNTIFKGQLHGYIVSYRDGVMQYEPMPCAAFKGTQIMVEKLFYNMTTRREILQKYSDDYARIVDLVSRFAIHHPKVGFYCRKHGAVRADVHTFAPSSRLDAIKSVYGVSVVSNLIEIEASDDDPSSSVFEMHGYMSNANYAAKKMTMVLFINDRLVECSALKRAIEIVYAATLPKASKPFIYISIVLPPENMDVNLHPTKGEVEA